MKTKILSPLLMTCVLVILSLNSCNENDDLSPKPTVSEADPSDKSSLADVAPVFYEDIKEDYEIYGKIIYNDLKYNPVDDPMDYLAEDLRKHYASAIDEVERKYEGLTIKQKLDIIKSEALLPDNVYKVYLDFFTDLDAKSETFNTPEEAWIYLRNYEKKLQSMGDVEGVELLLVYSSMFRNFIKYEFEVDEFTKQAMIADGISTAKIQSCLFGIKISCWETALTKAVMSTLLAGITGGLTGVIQAGAFWIAAIKEVKDVAASNFIKSVESAYANSTCGCGQTLPACTTPTGYRMIVDNCTLTQRFQVIGGGTSPNYFTYTVANGSLPEYQGYYTVSNIKDKLIKVNQTSSSTAIKLTVRVHCTDGTSYLYANEYNINSIVRNPGPVAINGATSVPLGDTETYYAYGTGVSANAKNSLSWSVNYRGQIVEKGKDYVKVKWNIKTDQYNKGTVYLNSTNACSNTTTYQYKNVDIY